MGKYEAGRLGEMAAELAVKSDGPGKIPWNFRG